MSNTRFSSVNKFIDVLTNRSMGYSGEATNPPMVSIISSFYNAHRYFEETFCSMMDQSMQNFEWIIVDDCSTDSAAVNLFETLEHRSSKIKTYRHSENKGLAAGRNTALAQASGKYLFFMDMDDLIDPTFLEKCVLFLELHPEFTFVSAYLVEFQDKEYWYPYIGEERIPNQIEQNCWSSMSMHRRSDFETLGGFDEQFRYFEDWERWTRAFANGQKAWTIPEYLQCYRRLASGLLSAGVAAEGTDKINENLIKNRYRKQFEESPPEIPILSRSTSYDADKLRERLEIENHLERDGNGKHILFLIPHLEIGGADKFNLDLLEIFKNKDYGLTIVTTIKSSHSWYEHFYNLTPDIFMLPNYSHENDWSRILRYLIESRKIDVVFVSNSYFGYYLVPLLRTFFPETVFIDYNHSRGLGWRIDGYARISRQLSSYFDAQIASSLTLAEYNYDHNPYAERIPDVCYVSLDSKKWIRQESSGKIIRRKYGITSEEVLILLPARLEWEKRPELFVNIVASLVKRGLPVKAMVLGKGDLQKSIEALIGFYNMENVFHILPPVSPEEMVDFYSAADIMMLPSEFEGIALAIYEAMAMELVVVASDVGGQKELVIEGTGYLIQKGDGDEREITEYVKVLEHLIKKPELRAQIGKAARQRVAEKFSLEIMGEKIEEIFDKALEKRKTQPPRILDRQLPEELLILAMENNLLESGWHVANRPVSVAVSQDDDLLRDELVILQAERDLLKQQKTLMEESKFWKIRKQWFDLKKGFGFSKDKH